MQGPYGNYGVGLGSYGLSYGRMAGMPMHPMALGGLGMSPLGYPRAGVLPVAAPGLGLGAYGYGGAAMPYGAGLHGAGIAAADLQTSAYLNGGSPYLGPMY